MTRLGYSPHTTAPSWNPARLSWSRGALVVAEAPSSAPSPPGCLLHLRVASASTWASFFLSFSSSGPLCSHWARAGPGPPAQRSSVSPRGSPALRLQLEPRVCTHPSLLLCWNRYPEPLNVCPTFPPRGFRLTSWDMDP